MGVLRPVGVGMIVAAAIVFGVISLDDKNPYDINDVEKRCIAGLSSDPKVVPIPVDSPVVFGWTWDGSTFTPPAEDK